MNNEFENFPRNGHLKDENVFLKMKLMLERGASFGKEDGKDLPAEIENKFLQNIIEFEKQFDEHKTIRVFDKIGKPTNFKPAADIPDEEIAQAWEALSDLLGEHGISLGVCSPNISKRELYRFTVEELFEYEMDDINIPGMVHGFIYDEFYPDAVYENTNAAIEECIKYILQKEPMEWTHHFRKENLQLNQHVSLLEEELKIIVNMFKLAYDDLEIKEINETGCIVDEKKSLVNGTYHVVALSGKDACTLAGNWEVGFEKDDELDYWYIYYVQIEGINF